MNIEEIRNMSRSVLGESRGGRKWDLSTVEAYFVDAMNVILEQYQLEEASNVLTWQGDGVSVILKKKFHSSTGKMLINQVSVRSSEFNKTEAWALPNHKVDEKFYLDHLQVIKDYIVSCVSGDQISEDVELHEAHPSWHFIEDDDGKVVFTGSKTKAALYYKKHGGSASGLHLMSMMKNQGGPPPEVGKIVEDVELDEEIKVTTVNAMVKRVMKNIPKEYMAAISKAHKDSKIKKKRYEVWNVDSNQSKHLTYIDGFVLDAIHRGNFSSKALTDIIRNKMFPKKKADAYALKRFGNDLHQYGLALHSFIVKELGKSESFDLDEGKTKRPFGLGDLV